MKFWLAIGVLCSLYVHGAVRTLPPIKTPDVISLGNGKSGYDAIARTKAISSVKEKQVQEPDVSLESIEKYKNVTTQKHNWKEKLKEINKSLEKAQNALAKSTNPSKVRLYQNVINNLRFYRGVVNLHLNNYGIAILDMRYAVQNDSSFLERKPVLYFDQGLTLNNTMNAVWKFMDKLDQYYCKSGLNNAACNEVMTACYAGPWQQSCNEVQYNNEPYNNEELIDISKIIDHFHRNIPCTSCIFVTEPLPTPSFGVVTEINTECQIYQHNKGVQYLAQLTKFAKIGGGGLQEVKDYLCRGFTNVMLLNEGTTMPNAAYIQGAKEDIKTAIVKNNALPATLQLKEVDDKIITAIFEKYNQIATKDMNEEQLALIKSATEQANLVELKTQAENRNAEIGLGYDGVDYSDVTSKTDEEIAGAKMTEYSPSILSTLTSINNTAANTLKTEDEKAQELLNSAMRVSQTQGAQTETHLETLLEMIDDLKQNGDF